MNRPKIYKLIFADVYPLYINKITSKGQSKDDLDLLIYWLTGYDEQSLKNQLDKRVDLEQFFNEAPALNANRYLITGSICGTKVQDIEDPTTRDIRYLDKIVDELARGKSLVQIMRTPE